MGFTRGGRVLQTHRKLYQAVRCRYSGVVRFFFIPVWNIITVKEIEEGTTYRAYYFDPRKGREYDAGTVAPDKNSEWQPLKLSIIQD